MAIWAEVVEQLSTCLSFSVSVNWSKVESKEICPSVKHSYRHYLSNGLMLDATSLSLRKVWI